MVRYRCIGYGTTDGNGVATLNKNLSDQTISGYTGQGVGEVDFVASAESPNEINSSSDVSETYNVWDTIFYIENDDDTYYDVGTTGAITKTATAEDGTHFKQISSGQIGMNIKDGSVHPFNATNDLVYEFDLKTAGDVSLYVVDNRGSRRLVLNYYGNKGFVMNTWVHFKWDYDATNKTVTPYLNGNPVIVDGQQVIVDLSDYNMTTIGFQIVDWGQDTDYYLKNWKIYTG